MIIKGPACVSHKGFTKQFIVRKITTCKFPRLNLASLENHTPEAQALETVPQQLNRKDFYRSITLNLAALKSIFINKRVSGSRKGTPGLLEQVDFACVCVYGIFTRSLLHGYIMI